jgi:hypothetical protein
VSLFRSDKRNKNPAAGLREPVGGIPLNNNSKYNSFFDSV